MKGLSEIAQELLAVMRAGGEEASRAKRLLGCLGEELLLEELTRRGVRAELTGGNRKAVDLVTADGKRIQVKTSLKSTVITRFYQKDFSKNRPDVWVLIKVSDPPEYYVVSHEEIGTLQLARNRGRKDPRGVDNLAFGELSQFRDAWTKVRP